MLLCGAIVALSAMPSQQAKARGISTRQQSFAAAHDPITPQQHRQHHQRHRSVRQRQKCRRKPQETHLLAAFAVLPRGRQRTASATEIPPRFLSGATSTYVVRPSRTACRRRRRRDSGLPRCHSTWLTASASPGGGSYTPQVLSPAEILEFVRRVDFFDLPPGGVTTGEAGYPRALPLQVGFTRYCCSVCPPQQRLRGPCVRDCD